MQTTTNRGTLRSLGMATLSLAAAGAIFAAAPNAAQAQTATTTDPGLMEACYVPGSGTVYRIRVAETPSPDNCKGNKHVYFSWNGAGIPGIQGKG
jgi:hypothetical protein